MSAAFTPGPWPYEFTGDAKRITIGKGLVEGPNGYEVAEVYSDDCDPAVAEANARLIATAPELYAALLDMWDTYAAPGCDATRKAKSALSKARGEA